MRIHCDACSAPIEEKDAYVLKSDDGELFYFCTEQCAVAAEELDPDRELGKLESSDR